MLEKFKTSFKIPARLIRDFIAGEEAAFTTIYRQFKKPILNHVLQKTRDEEAAQDLTQEIFLKVHRARGDYRPEFAFSTWLWTIASNTCVDWFRRGQLELSADASAIEELPSATPNVETLLQQRQSRRLLRGMIRKLTRSQRRVIWLRVIHQLSYHEISKKLGLSVSAVKCLASRSKSTLIELGDRATQNAASGALLNAARII